MLALVGCEVVLGVHGERGTEDYDNEEGDRQDVHKRAVLA